MTNLKRKRVKKYKPHRITVSNSMPQDLSETGLHFRYSTPSIASRLGSYGGGIARTKDVRLKIEKYGLFKHLHKCSPEYDLPEVEFSNGMFHFIMVNYGYMLNTSVSANRLLSASQFSDIISKQCCGKKTDYVVDFLSCFA